jgi:peptidoglycan/LPS O-acetylase OafA/YrhL
VEYLVSACHDRSRGHGPLLCTQRFSDYLSAAGGTGRAAFDRHPAVLSASHPAHLAFVLYYLLSLPKLAFLTVWPVNPLLGFTWILGAEEQFYVIWPWIMKLGRRHLPSICIVIIVLVVWSA